ncbi:DUF2828 family protein [Butyrivibrio sp. AE2032]|uniref:DUF2828 family protein n=1 Tax=Butyrivibrio sp. AE2032 TaxID=1458463 RepID=UPI000558F6DB|nr:DUF2828 family protein [Butyrivibrio sp. AE2032]
MLELLKKEANRTLTENGASTYTSTESFCLDLFATAGALRYASNEEIVERFIKAFAEDRDLAMKILFFARDIRGGLGERRFFKVILAYLASAEPETVLKNIENIAEYGRYDDILVLIGTPCEKECMEYLSGQLSSDAKALAEGKEISLLAKWLPSVNTSNKKAVRTARKIAKACGMTEAQYRKTLSALRAEIRIIENSLRERDYSFDYEKQPSRALFKYRRAFIRNDYDRYAAFITKAISEPSVINTGALTPYDIIAPVVKSNRKLSGQLSKDERAAIDATWNAQEDFTGSENALVVVDGSGSMYFCSDGRAAAVAQSLGIYFAERNTGAFRNCFITFSTNPQLVEIKGKDIIEKVRYCMSFNECSNTNIAKVFELILKTAVKNKVKQADMPSKIYIISDMEFDWCAEGADETNFEQAKKLFEANGYKLPQIIFWNVESRNRQQPVTKNEQGVALVSGSSPQIFRMLKEGTLEPYRFMLDVLMSERYEKIAA